MTVVLRSSTLLVLWCLAAIAGHAQETGYVCLLEPRESVVVGAPIVGRVAEILVERGDLIEAGQVVARLDSRVETATVDLARAHAEADAELHEAEARLAFEERRLERGRQLHSQNVISVHDIDEIESSLIVAEASARRAKENKLTAQLELARAEAILEQRNIRAPVSGIVVKRLASPGEYADPPQILEVAQVDPLRVEAYVPAAQAREILVGSTANVMPEASDGRRFPARVVVVDRVVDAASGMVGIRLELPNPEHALPAGLRCRVDFPAARAGP